MVTEESLAVKIEKEKGEDARLFLQKNDLIRSDLIIKKDEQFLYIPIICSSNLLSNYDIVTKRFEKTEERIDSYQQLLSLPYELQRILPLLLILLEISF